MQSSFIITLKGKEKYIERYKDLVFPSSLKVTYCLFYLCFPVLAMLSPKDSCLILAFGKS